ncbi:MAG: gamma-glutamyltransferase [Planctomycetales bacterium]|nr:gamma-glutamyltransferase [Planctomycetales bacterium]
MRGHATLALLAALACSRPEPAAVPAAAAVSAPAPLRTDAAVATAEPFATHAAADVLADGGNAVDAAVCAALTLAVTYPSAGNLGGGGFLVTWDPGTREAHALDFRETAPAAATRDMYLGPDGNPDPEKSLEGHLAVGVPGSVRGLSAAHRKFGRLPWKSLVLPAIHLAEEGIPVSAGLAGEFKRHAEKLARYPASAAAFLKADGSPHGKGDSWKQPDLARTLRRIAEGPSDFYTGETARLIVEEMKRGGGILDVHDLSCYSAAWRDPIRVPYRGREVVSMPPPSSGGVCVGMILRVLEGWTPAEIRLDDPAGAHRYVEAARRVYADRSQHLGDPDQWRVPLAWLLSPAYAAERRATIRMDGATGSRNVAPGAEPRREGVHTTHLSVLDFDGRAASLTTTINSGYGSHVTVGGAGFLLNNEMDDFSAKPGAPNLYGLVGGEANAVAPGKRMLSSMAPTVVLEDGRARLVVGTPGGSTIITSVFQVVTRVVDQGESLEAAVAAPRLHHQWLPDKLFHEKGRAPPPALLEALAKLGHTLEPRPEIGDVCAIAVDGAGRATAVADPRGRGLARTLPAWSRPETK